MYIRVVLCDMFCYLVNVYCTIYTQVFWTDRRMDGQMDRYFEKYTLWFTKELRAEESEEKKCVFDQQAAVGKTEVRTECISVCAGKCLCVPVIPGELKRESDCDGPR